MPPLTTLFTGTALKERTNKRPLLGTVLLYELHDLDIFLLRLREEGGERDVEIVMEREKLEGVSYLVHTVESKKREKTCKGEKKKRQTKI